ncbi:hypothetical protein I7I51_06006 [Histoplasma capsulatum]|uniref:Uncharacterized protein n=1 Tax=Ajellomyces capsulatus TaxID=5037 RepID=A0A8A1MKJ4_AJECA|nr:hypothetical protein I7I51_06006 [Histoplasma capsulatum]
MDLKRRFHEDVSTSAIAQAETSWSMGSFRSSPYGTHVSNFEDLLDKEAWRQGTSVHVQYMQSRRRYLQWSSPRIKRTTPHGIPAGLIIKETHHSHGRNLHSETRPAPLFEAVLEFEAGMLQPTPRRKKPMLATTYND